MSRCNECGSKECCGAHLGLEVEKLERQRDQLLEAAKEMVSHRVGALPRQGYIRDNDGSRTAAEKLVQAIAAVEGGNQP